MKKISQLPDGDDEDAEIRRLKRELTGVTDGRDILDWSRTSNRSGGSIVRRDATAWLARNAASWM